jgi:hypothetical protein
MSAHSNAKANRRLSVETSAHLAIREVAVPIFFVALQR